MRLHPKTEQPLWAQWLKIGLKDKDLREQAQRLGIQGKDIAPKLSEHFKTGQNPAEYKKEVILDQGFEQGLKEHRRKVLAQFRQRQPQLQRER